MVTRCIVLLFVLFSASTSFSQLGFNLIDNEDFTIQQGRFYRNPNARPQDQYNLQKEGPIFEESYVSDTLVKNLRELNARYPIGQANTPKNWPSHISLEGARFVVAVFENGEGMPVIWTKDGSVFGFLIEENFLTFDCKRISGTQSSRTIVYDTAELDMN